MAKKKLNIYAELFSISERFWSFQNVLTILSRKKPAPNPVNSTSLNLFQMYPPLHSYPERLGKTRQIFNLSSGLY